ncbi:MAG TPA: SpoIIE family protein phosphatase [Bacteriovoracaceae bacterium]|nr:SpoIIE family protein phosphatase [Bacteriovoracaceae bacterium]
MAKLRQVRFPLKLKLLTVMIVLIAASLTVFVGIALKIFREDKSAYIFETLLNKASSEQIILSQRLVQPGNVSRSAFEVKDGQLLLAGSNAGELLRAGLKPESSFTTKLVVPSGSSFYQYHQGKLSEVTGEERELLAGVTGRSLNQAVKEITQNGERILYAYDYNPLLNYAFVVSLPHEKAFAVTSYLVNKSLYYGIFILGLAMLISVVLARPLTSQLESLFGMTQQLALGNFDKRIDLGGNDEVGALSDSVNDMAEKIVVFMSEMKEKARLENEVHVAQLVQSSFFPEALSTDESLMTYGHFEPATECGGDWWGVMDHGDQRILFIADATGHGVPAALLTATINCCKTSLGFIIETRPDISGRPEEILRYMNQAVYGAGKEIQVTCFVACFNRKTKLLAYSNASHTPPLLFSSSSEALSKENFNPLIEANGPRLGQKRDSKFETAVIELKTHDTIFFYTDGLIEAEDAQGSRFGERRLIKSLAVHGRGNSQEIIAGVLGEFKIFTGGTPKNDDLTMVAMKVLA